MSIIRDLPYIVECDRKDHHGFHPIAAFDNETTALSYARSCDKTNRPMFEYRVKSTERLSSSKVKRTIIPV